ncbi:MAG: hypothetical protein ACC642_11600 [Pseudomonadales bacterium]
MEREKVVMIVGTTLFLLIPGVCGVALIGVGSSVNDIEAQSLEEVAPVPPIVTLAKFEQIIGGMSYREVVDVIGDPGIAMDPSAVLEGTDGDAGISRYIWQNSDASNMKATFQSDRLLDKSQVYLE